MRKVRVMTIFVLVMLVASAITGSIFLYLLEADEDPVLTIPVMSTSTPEIVVPTATVVANRFVQENISEGFVTFSTFVPSWADGYVDANIVDVWVRGITPLYSGVEVELEEFSLARLYAPSPVILSEAYGVRVVSADGVEVPVSGSCCQILGEFLVFPEGIGTERYLVLTQHEQSVKVLIYIVYQN